MGAIKSDIEKQENRRLSGIKMILAKSESNRQALLADVFFIHVKNPFRASAILCERKFFADDFYGDAAGEWLFKIHRLRSVFRLL